MFSRRSGEQYFALVLSFAASLGLIVAITWPWVLHFNGEFLNHWDPPFHAWKLEYMARRILAGDLFLSTGNTNMLYPHSGALYFEALQWPMALFAAPFFALTTLSSEVIYHITLLVFWALSAPCMYFLLRQLDCRTECAVAGAIVFCILPWRISYMVEFQMEMVFALPLFFGFVIRFFRTHRVRDAILAVFSWWLLAVSELYEAVFAAMAVPFILLAVLARFPEYLSKGWFWRGVFISALVGCGLILVLLLPYATLRSGGQVMRSMGEVAWHSAQPFSFLVPFGKHYPWTIAARRDEFSLYPTLGVLFLAFSGAIWRFFRDASNRKSWPLTFLLSVLVAASFIIFYGIGSFLQFRVVEATPRILRALRYSLWFFVLAPLAYAVGAHFRTGSVRAVFLKGLFAASVVMAVLSFGPILAYGPDYHKIAATQNTVYVFCYKSLFTFLSGFRVVSRFNVIGLLFLVCVASVVLDAAFCRITPRVRHHRLVCAAVAILFTASVVFEAIPSQKTVSNYLEIDNQRSSPVIGRLVENHPDATIAALPCGPREIEGMRMFSLLKGDFHYIYAWGGFFPEYSQRLCSVLASLDAATAHEELSRLYPPCRILVDRSIVVRAKKDVPDEYRSIADGMTVDFAKFASVFGELEDSDDRFYVFRLRPLPQRVCPTKIFRSDIAIDRPLLRCVIEAKPGIEVEFALNGSVLGCARCDAAGYARFACILQKEGLTERPFNEFSAHAKSGDTLVFEDFSLARRN